MGCSADKFDKRFPDQKQFLVTEKVPCSRRVKDVENAAQGIEEVDLGDGWTEAVNNDPAAKDMPIDMDAQMVPNGGQQAKDEDEEEIGDMDDMMAEMEEEQKNEAASDNIFAQGTYVAKDDLGDDMELDTGNTIKKVRKYDLSITYDFYHQTPRLWLLGYSEEGDILTQEEMFMDIMADYANKTLVLLSLSSRIQSKLTFFTHFRICHFCKVKI